MAKRKGNLIVGILILGILITFLALFIVPQTTIGDSAYIPEFGRVECTQFTLETDWAEVATSGKILTCGDNAYIPGECEFDVRKTSALGGFSIRTCNNMDDDCGFFSSKAVNGESVTIDSGERIKINPSLKPAEYKLKALSYRLETIDSGFKTVDPKGCKLLEAQKLSNVDNNKDNAGIKTTEYNGELHLAPGQLYHYVSGLSERISKNVVSINGINGGNPIYVFTVGSYYPLERIDEGEFSGTLVADTFNPISDNRIECLPADTFCSPEAKRISPTEKSCSDSGGLTGEFKPKTNDIYCKIQCNEGTGKLEYSNECKELTECSGDKPLRDPKTLECVAGSTPSLGLGDSSCNPILTVGKVDIIPEFKSGCFTGSYVLALLIGILIGISGYLLITNTLIKQKRKDVSIAIPLIMAIILGILGLYITLLLIKFWWAIMIFAILIIITVMVTNK